MKRDRKWLDLGCGHQIIPHWMPSWENEDVKLIENSEIVVGIDYIFEDLIKHKTLRHRVQGDIYYLPFHARSFDVITLNMVVEHIQYPKNALMEIYRILKPEGVCIIHTPNKLNYNVLLSRIFPEGIKKIIIKVLEDRSEEDVFPTFYRMNSSKDIMSVAMDGGFHVEIKLVDSGATAVMLGPIVVFELFLIRLLRLERLKEMRSHIIALLKKPSDSEKPNTIND